MRITFIGGGNMADALIGGLLRKDFPLQDIRVVEINADARRKLVDKYGVTCFDKPKDAVRAGDVIVFAVKPQNLREAASKSGIADNANLAISIAAGVRLANLSKWLKGHKRVTSKGGTTERALASMAKDEVKAAVIRAIHAANERGKELGEELGKE